MSKCEAFLPADDSWNLPECHCDGFKGHGRIKVTYADAGPADDDMWDHYDSYNDYGWNVFELKEKINDE